MDTRNHCHIPTSITELFQVSHNVALKIAEGIFNVTVDSNAEDISKLITTEICTRHIEAHL